MTFFSLVLFIDIWQYGGQLGCELISQWLWRRRNILIAFHEVINVCFEVRKEPPPNWVTVPLLCYIIYMPGCGSFSQINGFCAECVTIYTFSGYVLNWTLAVNTFWFWLQWLSLESKYMHSCKTGQYWSIGHLQNVCAFIIYWLLEKNRLIIYIIMLDKDCQ